MEKKIDIETLKEILQEHLEDTTQAEILKEINKALLEKEEIKDKEKKEKVEKKGVVILTTLPQGVERKDLENLTGFFTEIPEEDHPTSLHEKIASVKAAYNLSRKAKKNPAETLGDLFELAPAKILKEVGILKKPKGTVRFLHITNQI